ncbi:MAG TPA: ribonuclease III [Vicinamibacteria bacterium]|nr:ribonuclease III [Vicinamibacteria bacterium]
MDEARADALHALERRLGHPFADPGLLDRALTHTSHAHEHSGSERHNEPLEFLGDAVIGFLVADLLHRRAPEGNEGGKSKARAHLVSAPSLARRAEALGLPDLLLLGRGEEKTGGRQKSALWANAYEAVVAALYLDGGLEAAARFVAGEFAAELAAPMLPDPGDHKSALQELLQARGQEVPEYVTTAEEGPSHRRSFRVDCRIDGEVVAEGHGHSKKKAQQEAARRALLRVRG